MKKEVVIFLFVSLQTIIAFEDTKALNEHEDYNVSAVNEVIILQEEEKEIYTLVGEDFELPIVINRLENLNESLEVIFGIDYQIVSQIVSINQELKMNWSTHETYNVKMKADNVGVTVMRLWFNANETLITTKNHDKKFLYFTVMVGRAQWINCIGEIFGWIYVTLWNLSFYPQIFSNFRRRR